MKENVALKGVFIFYILLAAFVHSYLRCFLHLTLIRMSYYTSYLYQHVTYTPTYAFKPGTLLYQTQQFILTPNDHFCRQTPGLYSLSG